MSSNEWLKNELKNVYGGKAETVYSAILNSREIQFSSPEAEAKFTAILAEWNRQGEVEMPDEDQDAGQYPTSTSAPQAGGDPLAEYRKVTTLSLAERKMYVGNVQK